MLCAGPRRLTLAEGIRSSAYRARVTLVYRAYRSGDGKLRPENGNGRELRLRRCTNPLKGGALCQQVYHSYAVGQVDLQWLDKSSLGVSEAFDCRELFRWPLTVVHAALSKSALLHWAVLNSRQPFDSRQQTAHSDLAPLVGAVVFLQGRAHTARFGVSAEISGKSLDKKCKNPSLERSTIECNPFSLMRVCSNGRLFSACWVNTVGNTCARDRCLDPDGESSTAP